MTEEETLQKLNLLGINDPHQLEAEELNFWWQKKYREIQKLNLRNSIFVDDTASEKISDEYQFFLLKKFVILVQLCFELLDQY